MSRSALAEQSYGTDHLDLVLAKGYLTKLLCNARVARYLAQDVHEILTEFQRIAEMEGTVASRSQLMCCAPWVENLEGGLRLGR